MRDTGAVTRRALLIGSETYGLSGCDADVLLMRDVLAARGFDTIDIRRGTDAGRAGIVDGLDELAGSITGPADAVVLYYSGHGGRVARPDFEERRAARASAYFQFVVPYDMDESDTGDFRGFLSEEITWHQRRLTDAFHALGAVPNVTTILDCCHAGYMARGVETRPKSVDLSAKMFRIRGIRDHAISLMADMELHGLATNPDAVRLVACQPEESAFEFPSARGGRHGAMTDALATVIDELGDAPVSWATVADLVRRRVRSLVPEQRPDIEGPADRLLFSDRTLPSNALALSTVEGDLRIESAAMLGIEVGDEFTLVTAGAVDDDDDTAATAVVARMDGGDAVLAVTPADGAGQVGAGQVGGAVAVPTKLRRPPTPVALDVPGDAAADLRSRVAASVLLAEAPEPSSAVVRITTESGRFVLNDHAGGRWRVDPYPDTDDGRTRLIDDIEAIAIGHRLLDLPSGTGPSALDAVVAVELGAFAADGVVARPLHGERFPVGTSLALSFTNVAADPVFVWAFDVGVSGRSALLTNAAPSGTMLGPAGAEDDTVDLWDADGEQLVWPIDVPMSSTDGEPGRWETFVVLIADQRGDLSSLASRRVGARGAVTSALQAVMDEARTGVREVAPSVTGAPPLRYRIETVDFVLVPD